MSRSAELANHVELEEAAETFKAKAPVCLCKPGPCSVGEDMCGPQRKALRAEGLLHAQGAEFPEGMRTAISHALTGEGRGEFDDLMRGWSP